MPTFLHRFEVLHRLGPAWSLWRAGYEVRRRTGVLKRRFQTRAWADVRLCDLVRKGVRSELEAYRNSRNESTIRFLFKPSDLPPPDLLRRVIHKAGVQRVLDVADDYCAGRFLFYSRRTYDLGWPVNWLRDPVADRQHDGRRHWCDSPTFTTRLGDVKDVWEPSRFACAYWLVRAYALTRDEKYPSAFWQMFEEWCRQNPPNMGPNWKCGQEAAVRVFAWCFALFGFWQARATTPERVVDMAKMIALHGERIAGNIGYAISQKNNHGLSESIGLMTIGLLFPEFKSAPQWLARGRRVLEQEVRRQIYDDGSYVQHSTNYHRVMLHDCLWAIRIAELNDRPLSKELTDRVGRAGAFLHELLEVESGDVPNYGANDGALVLPLTACGYRDFRPAVQAARFQATGRRVLEDGPWDEMLVWLYGADSLAADRQSTPPSSRRFDVGGYYTLRDKDRWCMIRCHTYRDRPAHVDMLHVDLWYRGVNVLGDSGSYRYYCPDEPEAEHYFKDISAHNSIEIEGRGPLALVSRFLWLPWPRAKCIEHTGETWIGEHHAYDRAPQRAVHRRAVHFDRDGDVTITDDVMGRGSAHIKLFWHLTDAACRPREDGFGVQLQTERGPVTVAVQGPPGISQALLRGRSDEGRFFGWTSLYYGQRTPRPVLVIEGRWKLPVRLVTRVVFGEDARG